MGDVLYCFEGILLGSLFYVFGKFEEGMSLFEVIGIVKENGFIEFDFCDDLSGMDVVCKLLIMVCEVDLELEFDDIEIELVLFKGFVEDCDIVMFME